MFLHRLFILSPVGKLVGRPFWAVLEGGEGSDVGYTTAGFLHHVHGLMVQRTSYLKPEEPLHLTDFFVSLEQPISGLGPHLR